MNVEKKEFMTLEDFKIMQRLVATYPLNEILDVISIVDDSLVLTIFKAPIKEGT